MQRDDGLDAVPGTLVALQLGQERLLVHVQGLGVQDAEDVFLAGEVVVEAADADAALLAEAGQRGGRDPVLAEPAEGTLDDPGGSSYGVLAVFTSNEWGKQKPCPQTPGKRRGPTSIVPS
ncbi:hypothetical protein GCM10017559_23900 [Streptosporangium longisporum]|uniref:Uncharacterized protein n=1 Tax=Streptosporangium longisporum TaxID=46187 RepID=A0ABP6KCV7_9ACTN